MGVHNAYHRALANRLIHWAAIPLELWAVVALLSYLRLGPLGDGALVALVLISPIYLATEPVLGALMIASLAGGRAIALHAFGDRPVWGAIGAAVVFAVTFFVQVRVGHGVFEDGRDDTNMNLAELRATKNPIPILLVFYYHLVDLALVAGYRPSLRREIDAVTTAELERIGR